MLESLLNNWQWYGIGGGVLFGFASYFLGIGAILRILASIIEMVTPLVRGAFEAVIEWIKIMYAGLGNIFGSWKTVVTVLSLLAIAYGTAKVPTKIELAKCKQETKQLQKKLPSKELPKKKQQLPEWETSIFPWDWR